MITEFQRYIQQNRLIAGNERILLAVSGGRDSMVMLDLFVRSGYNVGVAHCNFALRGAESDADEDMVRSVISTYGVPLYVTRFDTKGEAAECGESIQMAARRLRYRWFVDLCIGEGFDKIAVAHHIDDSVETFFINLMRGTGLRGLTGISTENGRVIRPMLFASRDRITDYAANNNVRSRDDSSNEEVKYLRNRLRHDIIPRMEDTLASFQVTMAENLLRLENTQRFVDQQIDRIRSVAEKENIIDISIVEQHGNVNFVMFELLRPYGFAPDVIDDLCGSLDKSGKKFISPNYIAYIDRRRVIVEQIILKATVDELIQESDSRIELIEIDRLLSLSTPSNVALLSVGPEDFPLKVRLWREGDSFIPLGMQGHKKVSDFLIDSKVALKDKADQYVLTTATDEIMWLIGRRIDERFKITERTKKAIRIKL